jgi:hypothetical protein
MGKLLFHDVGRGFNFLKKNGAKLFDVYKIGSISKDSK